MKVLRTPDERFEGLPGYPFEPRYIDVQTSKTPLRLHYIDAGRTDGVPIILLHGQPSWSYLYRMMTPKLAEAGLRVLAPDLVGFGRSDKPASINDYSYARHVGWIGQWLDKVDPRPATLFAHDWGGFIGLRVLTEQPDRFERVVVSNTGLPDGRRLSPLEIFYTWRQFVRDQEEFAAGNVVQLGSVSELPADVVAAYDAPYPDESYKQGIRAFPELVPTSADEPEARANARAWVVLENWRKPFLTIFGELDPMNAGNDEVFQRLVPGAA